MSRISTYTQFFTNTSGLLRGQDAMADAQRQASSGKKAQDIKGYGADAARLLSAKAVAARLETRNDALKALESRAQVEATALDSASTAVADARQAVMNAIANQNGAGLRTALEQALATVFTAANQQYAGQYLFGGTVGYDQPTNPIDLETLATLPDTSLQFNETGENRQLTMQDGYDITMSGSAREIFGPFIDMLRDIRRWEQDNAAPLNGRLTNAQMTYLQGLVPQITAVHSGVIDQEAAAGTRAKQLELSILANEEKITALNQTIGEQENADLAEVSAKLNAARVQYEASASIFGQLRNLNLLQFLR
jgi:flagellar hook-associated protein 3 FlgL